MGLLLDAMPIKPAALVINGDLTDYGHPEQRTEFEVAGGRK